MTHALRWIHADPGVREVVDAWWAKGAGEPADPTVGRTSEHRAVIRLDGPSGPRLVKHYLPGNGLRRLRDRARTAFGLGAAQREWRGFALLARAGVPAPRALGLAHSSAGDAVLVSEALPGQTLWDRLEARTPDRRSLLASVADLVATLHRAGIVHGDLHPGNILIGPAGPVLLDLQGTARARPGGARQRADLGLLDYSLRQFDVSRTDRLRVLCRALSLDGVSPNVRRKALTRAIRAAERVRARQTRTRAHHGRTPAVESDWMR
jgi:tRNA A-37 threonylcarbamoyl transferase component Bud32